MRNVAEIRRLRLLQLQKELGMSFADMSERLGRSRRDATLSQVASRALNSRTGKPRQMGHEQARRIEARFNKPDGWLDSDPEVDAMRRDIMMRANAALPELAFPPAANEPAATYGARHPWPFTMVSEAQIAGLPPELLLRLEAVILGFLAGLNRA